MNALKDLLPRLCAYQTVGSAWGSMEYIRRQRYLHLTSTQAIFGAEMLTAEVQAVELDNFQKLVLAKEHVLAMLESGEYCFLLSS